MQLDLITVPATVTHYTPETYEALVKTLSIYKLTVPPEQHLPYTLAGLIEETGEVSGKIKKTIRDKGGVFDAAVKQTILLELGDCLFYTTCSAIEWGSSLKIVTNGDTFESLSDFIKSVVLEPDTILSNLFKLSTTVGKISETVSNLTLITPEQLKYGHRVEDALHNKLYLLREVLIYITHIAMKLGFTLQDVAAGNAQKLIGRSSRGTLQGSGDNR